LQSKVVLRKSLGIFLLVITAGLASCQSFLFSWIAEADGTKSVQTAFDGQPIRRN
jgi:hypothetical protein